jgi:hypothetical protein
MRVLEEQQLTALGTCKRTHRQLLRADCNIQADA